MSKGLSMWRSFMAGARAGGSYRQLWSPWRQQQMVPSDEHQSLLLLRTLIVKFCLCSRLARPAVSEGVHEPRDAAC